MYFASAILGGILLVQGGFNGEKVIKNMSAFDFEEQKW
jgi:hypothetical protein